MLFKIYLDRTKEYEWYTVSVKRCLMMPRENVTWGQLDNFSDIVEHNFEYKNNIFHVYINLARYA